MDHHMSSTVVAHKQWMCPVKIFAEKSSLLWKSVFKELIGH